MADARHLHVLLTKYNTRFPGDTGDRPRGLDPAWLDGRLELFARGPIDSVRRQTRPPDSWFVFVDADTPPVQRAALAELVGDSASLVEVSGPLSDGVTSSLVRDRLGLVEQTVLVTTRLDSDDGLSADHLERVGRAATTHRGFINPTTGLQVVGSSVLLRFDRSGPFLSFVEEAGPGSAPRTAFCVPHYDAHRVAPVHQLSGVAWVQVVHGGNVANQSEGLPYPRRRGARLLGYPLPHAGGTPGLTPRTAVVAVGRLVSRETRDLVRRRLR